MLELSELTLTPEELGDTYNKELALLIKQLARKLRLKPDDLSDVSIKKSSIDARKKDQVVVRYTVRFNVKDKRLVQKLLKRVKKLKEVAVTRPTFSGVLTYSSMQSPVIVGGGCAGIFAALELAHAGLKPILIERGESSFARQETINRFNAGAHLNTNSNIQFGIGGAGTFSDGKLSTGTKSPIHQLILETFVKAGASPRILFEAKPHIGSDVLVNVVDFLCQEIQQLGGTILYNTAMVDLHISDGSIRGVRVIKTNQDTSSQSEETILSDNIILSCGHSARDVYEMLYRRNIDLERKTFAMGVRIEHLQSDINTCQYGKRYAVHSVLGAAPYKLVAHVDERRSAFSFCMCPGGYVVCATSEKHQVVTNGMSLSDRSGINANSGLLANVYPEDLPGSHPLEGMYLQRACEKKAFELGEGDYKAPAMLVGDFLRNQSSTGPGTVLPTYPRGVTYTNFAPCLPDYITQTLRSAVPLMARKLKAFEQEDALLTALESRSSAPVRMNRTEKLMSTSLKGLWPCGEGAGYAGGIMSAATDGIRVARALIETMQTN